MDSSPDGKNGKPNAFKRAQVRHKRQGSKPNRTDDLAQFVDFANPTNDDRVVHVQHEVKNNEEYQGPVYELAAYPGFLCAPQALSVELQTHLGYLAVSEFCERPHATNIGLVEPKANEVVLENLTMWELWKSQSVTGPRKGSDANHYRSFNKLSWATMGYQYDWTERAYHEDAKSPVPPILDGLATKFAKLSMRLEKAESTSFNPSACIVNYYGLKSTMGGHRDDLELALNKPVISFSMGLPAVFLLGGETKDEVPVVPILVRPGDVMILGGASRLNYHGMARLIPNEVVLPEAELRFQSPQPYQLDIGEKGNGHVDDEKEVTEFLRTHRININVRQVLPDGLDCFPSVASKRLDTDGPQTAAV